LIYGKRVLDPQTEGHYEGAIKITHCTEKWVILSHGQLSQSILLHLSFFKIRFSSFWLVFLKNIQSKFTNLQTTKIIYKITNKQIEYVYYISIEVFLTVFLNNLHKNLLSVL
jgi:hypothetical protein